MIKSFAKKCRKIFKAVQFKGGIAVQNMRFRWCDSRGDFTEVAVKIIIGVVIGALVLGGLYALWENVIMPRLNVEVESLFGGVSTTTA